MVLFFAGLSYSEISLLERVEGAIYKLESRICLADKGSDQRIVIVDIDEKSIDALGSWPWPRRLLAEMVDLLRSGGAKAVGLNLPMMAKEDAPGLEDLRAFRDKFEAYALSKEDPGTDVMKEDLLKLEERADEEKELVQTIGQHGNVILPVFTRLEKGQRRVNNQDDSVISKNFLTEKGLPSGLREKISVSQLFLPYAELAKAASGLGFVDESQKVGRECVSHQLFLSYKGALLPSLPLRAAIAYLGLQPKQVVVEKDQLRLKTYAIPTSCGELLIKFNKGMLSFPQYSFADIFRTQKGPPRMAGKAVLIGSSFKELANFDTPLGHDLSVTQMHACVLENILNQSVMQRPSYLIAIEILAILLVGAVTTLLFLRVGQPGRVALALLLLALTFGAAFSLVAIMDIWFKTVYIAACIVTLYSVVTVGGFLISNRSFIESAEANRALGLAFQKEGLLDLAFEKFRKLPLNEATKDLLYNLGLDFEQRRMIRRALAVYQHMQQGGSFKDVNARMAKLREAEASPIVPIHVPPKGASPLDETIVEERTKIGRYEILGVLGRGSMGLVYKALDPKLNRLLAIKTLRFSDEFDEDVIEEIKNRFLREAEIAGKLSHPSIVTIHDLGEDGDLTFMAMEFLEGVDLEKFVTKEKLLALPRVFQVVASVAEAVDFAHRANVVHRDIKPANIMLLKAGGVKVTDFGIAKAISSSRTKTGVILGTPNYMSPEQIMGQKIDYRSDIFSLGVLFFQLLTGELPFQGDNLSSLLYQITQRKHPKVRDLYPKLPVACDQIIDKALSKNPDQRFKSAGELARMVKILALKVDQAKRKRSALKQEAVKS